MTKIIAFLALFLMLAAPAFAEEAATAPAADKAVAAPASDGLDQPLMDDKALTAWATGAASETMTFDYRNFQERFLRASPHFTKTGWQTFSSSLKNSGIFDDLRKKNLTLTATAAKAEIKEQGAVDGKYRWTVTFPLAVHFKNTDDEESDTTQRIRLVVTRVPSSESAEGIQIASWELQ